jgi:hypothetical protein
MFNLPWELREQTEPISSKGPSFKWAPRYSCSLSGTQLTIKVPRNRYSVASREVKKLPRYYDVQEWYGATPWRERDYPIATYTLIKCAYDFYGDNFTGVSGSIFFSGILIKPLNMTEGLNFFHPRALENFIVSKMTDNFGDRFSLDGKIQEWNGPVNWQPQANWPIPAVRFEMQADQRCSGDDFESYLFFPVSRHHMVQLTCKVVRHRPPLNLKSKFTRDEWNDPNPYRELIDQIYSSVQVALSPEAENQRQQAIAGLQDASLVKEFPPFYWQKKHTTEKKSLV